MLKNNEGMCQIQFRVNVLSPPSKPEGPLEASNVTAEGCKLNWKPSVDIDRRRKSNVYDMLLSHFSEG
jgi:hypothetical protein